MLKQFLILILALVSCAPLGAHGPFPRHPVDYLRATDGRPIANYTLDPGASVTSQSIEIGDSAYQAYDWHITPVSGSPAVQVIMLQCNDDGGPFTEWTAPLDGSSPTTTVTITTTSGGSPQKLTPSRWIRYRFVQLAGVSAQITARSFAQ